MITALLFLFQISENVARIWHGFHNAQRQRSLQITNNLALPLIILFTVHNLNCLLDDHVMVFFLPYKCVAYTRMEMNVLYCPISAMNDWRQVKKSDRDKTRKARERNLVFFDICARIYKYQGFTSLISLCINTHVVPKVI